MKAEIASGEAPAKERTADGKLLGESIDRLAASVVQVLTFFKTLDPALHKELIAAQTQFDLERPHPDTPLGWIVDLALQRPPLSFFSDSAEILQRIEALLEEVRTARCLAPLGSFAPLTEPVSAAGWRKFQMAASKRLRALGYRPREIINFLEGVVTSAGTARVKSRIYR